MDGAKKHLNLIIDLQKKVAKLNEILSMLENTIRKKLLFYRIFRSCNSS